MKSMLYAAVEQAPSAELVEPDILTRYFAKFDEQFFSFCDKELTKINTFYSGAFLLLKITCSLLKTFVIVEKLAEATRRFASLKSELCETQEVEFTGKNSKKSKIKQNLLRRKKNIPARKMQELKLAFSEFYLSLILLQNYQNLNFTGFRKILKKHDKVSVRWQLVTC